MIDLSRWIYSKNSAEWLAKNATLNPEEQIDCICAAPHRTLEEKLEGLQELKSQYDGEVIYVQNTYNADRCDMFPEIDMGYFDAVKVSYPSGTIVSIPENPFLPSLKGVLVNTTEPDEKNFLDDPYNQWLIYPTSEHRSQTHGIGFVNLGYDYMPFENSPDFIFPYKQLIDVYKDDLKENEVWMSEFSALINADKNCIRNILHDREPKNGEYISMDEERLKYVQERRKIWKQ